MSTKLDSLPVPVANLFRSHQVERAAAPGLVPSVGPAQSLSYDKYSPAKSIFPKDGQGIFSKVGISVIESEKNWLGGKTVSRAEPLQPITGADAVKPSLRKPADLPFKLLRRNRQTADRFWMVGTHMMIEKHWQFLAELPLQCFPGACLPHGASSLCHAAPDPHQ